MDVVRRLDWLLKSVGSLWNASQTAQQESAGRLLASLVTLSVLTATSVIVYFVIGSSAFLIFVCVGCLGFLLGTAALHHRDTRRRNDAY